MFRSRIWHLWFSETWWEKAKGHASLMVCFSSGLHCPSFSFRNWYVDEPSCGSEVCVVMYHQPSAPPGIGGSYMFQWNDDRCNMKNNFICKYHDGNDSFPNYTANFPTSFSISKTAAGTKNLSYTHWGSLLQMPETLNFENSCTWKRNDTSSLRNSSSKGEASRCKRRAEKGKDLIYLRWEARLMRTPSGGFCCEQAQMLAHFLCSRLWEPGLCWQLL